MCNFVGIPSIFVAYVITIWWLFFSTPQSQPVWEKFIYRFPSESACEVVAKQIRRDSTESMNIIFYGNAEYDAVVARA